jgi:homocysteine S-methyltransferase
MHFEHFIESAAVGLCEGSIYERLRRDPAITLDPHLSYSALIYEDRTARILEAIHREYLDIGQRFGLAMIVQADTWRANRERIRQSRFRGQPVNQDNVRFTRRMCEAYASETQPFFVGGLMGPKGDAYRAREALSAAGAEAFHAYQAEALAEAGVDFLYAATLPAYSEAYGIASAMAKTKLPYMLSFIVRRHGTLLDGTPLDEAIEALDQNLPQPPIAYSINCVHPSVFMAALTATEGHSPEAVRRVVCFQGNTSDLDPEQLDGSTELQTEAPEPWAEMMRDARSRFRTVFVGGCCGTDARHLQSLAGKLRAAAGSVAGDDDESP